MATKQFDINDIGQVTVTKSRRSKHIRLTLKHDGSTQVSVPYWTPYGVALEYVATKKAWIKQHKVERQLLEDNIKIGKAHRLRLVAKDIQRISTRTKDSTITVTYPIDMSWSDQNVQSAARRACLRALTLQANELLPKRLEVLAATHGFEYNNVSVRNLKSRWGSCNNKKEITLSCFLMQLSWKEIDYVLLHELTHTVHMSHSKSFWTLLTTKMPEAKTVKKLLSTQKPQVIAQ